jgi:hypothetical protein
LAVTTLLEVLFVPSTDCDLVATAIYVNGSAKGGPHQAQHQVLPVQQKENSMTRLFLSVVAAVSIYLGPSQLAEAGTLTIISLSCRGTDDDGEDECELRVTASGSQDNRRRDMNVLELWQLNRRYVFRASAVVELWELDVIDRDDKLGAVIIKATTPPGEYKNTFVNIHGARYILKYRVGR